MVTPIETIKDDSAYPEFDELAFAMLNDLLFFSGLTKLVYFTQIGVKPVGDEWNTLRARVKACETLVYRIEDEDSGYKTAMLELESIFDDCIKLMSEISPVSPWGDERERNYRESLALLETRLIFHDFF